MSQEVIAQLHNVTKRYGAIEAVRGLSLEIRRGELVALLGPNGAGKTTAVKLLLGLSAASAGRVSVFGGDPRDRVFRTRTGVMLQVARVPETLRVREHIELFRSYYPDPLPLARVLQAARLESLSERYFRDLSGGEKQRTLFAMAICGNPELLVLDEPTVGLDVETRRAIWMEIEAFVARGGSVLLTTHYLAEADALANRVIVVAEGAVVAEGTPEEIKRRTSNRKVSFRSAAAESLIATLPAVASLRRTGTHYEVSVSAREAFVRALLVEIADVSELEISGGALEDAFVALTSNDSSEVAA
jgi:ABC-2 type transport system ATP-binding protein